MTEPTIISTPDGIELFQLESMKGRLALEVKTGLKFRGSTLAAVNRMFGTNLRTKKQALQLLTDAINDMEG